MDRITSRVDGRVVAQDSAAILDRLAAYEDSGFNPDQVQLLAKARKMNRLFIMPCYEGDTLYRVVAKPLPHRPEALRYHVQKTTLANHNALFVMQHYNKLVFRDRAKAEARAKAMNREAEAVENVVNAS